MKSQERLKLLLSELKGQLREVGLSDQALGGLFARLEEAETLPVETNEAGKKLVSIMRFARSTESFVGRQRRDVEALFREAIKKVNLLYAEVKAASEGRQPTTLKGATKKYARLGALLDGRSKLSKAERQNAKRERAYLLTLWGPAIRAIPLFRGEALGYRPPATRPTRKAVVRSHYTIKRPQGTSMAILMFSPAQDEPVVKIIEQIAPDTIGIEKDESGRTQAYLDKPKLYAQVKRLLLSRLGVDDRS
jgi:hypothetical protein